VFKFVIFFINTRNFYSREHTYLRVESSYICCSLLLFREVWHHLIYQVNKSSPQFQLTFLTLRLLHVQPVSRFKILHFCRSVFMCFVRILEQTENFALHSIQ